MHTYMYADGNFLLLCKTFLFLFLTWVPKSGVPKIDKPASNQLDAVGE